MSTYEELFPALNKAQFDEFLKDPNNGGKYPTVEDNPMIRALCALVDATREQTEEFRALRIAMTGADRSFVDTPGRAVYPFCTTCNCHHHPEDDNCILRGGMGAVDITTVRPAAESQEQNAADAATAMADASWKNDPGHNHAVMYPCNPSCPGHPEFHQYTGEVFIDSQRKRLWDH